MSSLAEELPNRKSHPVGLPQTVNITAPTDGMLVIVLGFAGVHSSDYV